MFEFSFKTSDTQSALSAYRYLYEYFEYAREWSKKDIEIQS